ncbi:MAG: hypothetical protein GX945_07885 [Lentisphaerae bacterium]|nr:hypothetical protein [Lentisphaerota bacterium]
MPPLNANITFNTSTTQNTAHFVEAQFSSRDSIALQKFLADGSDANQCNLIVEKRGAAGITPESLDLSLVNSQSGEVAAFANVKALIVCNKGADNPLEVAGAYFGSAAAIVIPPGGALVLILGAGVDISAGVNDAISVGSALGTDYELRIVGVKVEEPEPSGE